MSTCRACGSILETRDVQIRAADEAHTSITSCPSCPVNPNKIDSTKMPLVPLKGMNRKIRRSFPPAPRGFVNTRSLSVVVIDIPSSHEFMGVQLESHHLIQYCAMYNKRASDSASSRLLSAFSVIRGIFKDNCVSFKCSKVIGMGAVLDTYDMLTPSVSMSSQVVIKGTYADCDAIPGYNAYVYCDFDERNRKLIIELGREAPSNYLIRNIISAAYERGVVPNNISRYVGADTIAVFGNLSPRGWDASMPPKLGYKFTCKPDGQNVWLLWVGNIWYKTDPRCRRGIIDWTWTDATNYGKVVALSAEDMASYGCVVIDCFTNEYGEVSNSSRDIEWVTSTAQAIVKTSPELPLIVREYFSDYDLAVEYTSRLMYPIDGIVAIRNESTEILKIKPVRSTELVLAENGILLTSEDTPVMECPSHIAALYQPGSILEVRFKVHDYTTIEVLDIFQRTDKTAANSDNAVSNIIRSAHKLLTPEDNERRAALLWCNSLRSSLHSSALSRIANSNIILDVGTGTGQSLDSMIHSESISYVLVEPDEDRCKSIARRLGIKRISATPSDIVPMVKSLKTRAIRFAIMNCTLSDILEHERASSVLLNETKAIVCTFSMQFIVRELHYIVSNYRIPVYGCAYTYDGMTNNGVLVDDCGVIMKREHDNEAVIKWGGDKRYTESITLRRDYAGIGRVVPGFEVVQPPNKTIAAGAFNICKHITVIMP